MSRFARGLGAATVAVLLVAASASAAQERQVGDGAPPPVISSDRVIVEWVAGASPTERRAAREEAAVNFERDLGDRRFQLVAIEPGQTPRGAVRELEEDPALILAERGGYAALDSVPQRPAL